MGLRTTAPLRVAFCIDTGNIGGTELNAVRTARHLVEAGVDLSVFTLSGEGPLLQAYTDLGIRIDALRTSKLYSPRTFACGSRMAGMIRRRGIQVVHAHDFYTNIFAAPWVRLAGAAFVASRRWWEGPDRRSQRWANRLSYLFANRVLANSESVADLLVRGELVRRSGVVVVPNFLDEEAFAPPPPGWTETLAGELGLPEQRVVIGCVASLSPIKDHATLLRAIALLAKDWPTLHLVLVGEDRGSRSALEQLVHELGIADRVRFAGLRANQPSTHHLFDISVLSSVSEGMPNSVLEALACARPVVATAVGAVPDAITEGDNGFLVRPGDVEQLRDRLHHLLADPARAHRMGARARERAQQQYSSGAAIGRLIEIYRSLATRVPSGRPA